MESNDEALSNAAENSLADDGLEHVEKTVEAAAAMTASRPCSRPLDQCMSITPALDRAVDSTRQGLARFAGTEELKDLHVRVPLVAWKQARIAALQSGVSFKEYLTWILRNSTPLATSREADTNPR